MEFDGVKLSKVIEEQVIKKLGKGTYGSVHLIKAKVDGQSRLIVKKTIKHELWFSYEIEKRVSLLLFMAFNLNLRV